MAVSYTVRNATATNLINKNILANDQRQAGRYYNLFDFESWDEASEDTRNGTTADGSILRAWFPDDDDIADPYQP